MAGQDRGWEPELVGSGERGWRALVGIEKGHGTALKSQEGELQFLCNGFISAKLK